MERQRATKKTQEFCPKKYEYFYLEIRAFNLLIPSIPEKFPN